MTWENVLQIALLMILFALLTNLVANNVVTHFWVKSSKYYNDNEDLRGVSDEKPEPWTTGNAV